MDDISNKEVDLNDMVGKSVVIRGIAHDAKAGALVAIDGGEVVYISERASWPPAWIGKRVTLEGKLNKRRNFPEPDPNNELIEQAMQGIPFVLELDRYSLDENQQ